MYNPGIYMEGFRAAGRTYGKHTWRRLLNRIGVLTCEKNVNYIRAGAAVPLSEVETSDARRDNSLSLRPFDSSISC
jgi:hypothetical protein